MNGHRVQVPQVFVVRQIEGLYAVHPLDSELIRYYPNEGQAIQHALFLLRWLGHTGDPVITRSQCGEILVSFNGSMRAQPDLWEI